MHHRDRLIYLFFFIQTEIFSQASANILFGKNGVNIDEAFKMLDRDENGQVKLIKTLYFYGSLDSSL